VKNIGFKEGTQPSNWSLGPGSGVVVVVGVVVKVVFFKVLAVKVLVIMVVVFKDGLKLNAEFFKSL
jgi:hypothetical protein